MKAYFADAATEAAVHSGFVEHEEVEISDEELRALKARARRAVTMDGGQRVTDAYRAFLDGGRERGGYDAFLRGEH